MLGDYRNYLDGLNQRLVDLELNIPVISLKDYLDYFILGSVLDEVYWCSNLLESNSIKENFSETEDLQSDYESGTISVSSGSAFFSGLAQQTKIVEPTEEVHGIYLEDIVVEVKPQEPVGDVHGIYLEDISTPEGKSFKEEAESSEGGDLGFEDLDYEEDSNDLEYEESDDLSYEEDSNDLSYEEEFDDLEYDESDDLSFDDENDLSFEDADSNDLEYEESDDLSYEGEDDLSYEDGDDLSYEDDDLSFEDANEDDLSYEDDDDLSYEDDDLSFEDDLSYEDDDLSFEDAIDNSSIYKGNNDSINNNLHQVNTNISPQPNITKGSQSISSTNKDLSDVLQDTTNEILTRVKGSVIKQIRKLVE